MIDKEKYPVLSKVDVPADVRNTFLYQSFTNAPL